MEKRGASHSSRYGHACTACFKAKCRCIPLQGAGGCERCRRLKKHCTPSNSIRRRAADQKQDSDGRIARLEGLVSILQSREIPDGDNMGQYTQGYAADRLEGPQFLLDPFLAAPIPRTPNNATPDTSACLDTFRSHMLPHFPFMILPAHWTPRQLRKHHPILLRAITCVTAATARERRTYANELKRVLLEAAFLQQQRDDGHPLNNTDQTTDLLLAILTYAAWGWDSAHLSRLVSLAMSLVGEMRPDKPASSDLRTMALLTPGAKGWDVAASEHTKMQHFSNRQRAVLACFVLSSVVSTYYGEVDALRWTPQMEDALVVISASTESPTDATLAMQVRLQMLTLDASQMRDHGPGAALPAAEALLSQLQALRPIIQQHHGAAVLAQMYHTELSILETLHETSPLIPTVAVPTYPPTASPPPTRQGSSDPSHTWQSALAIQSCASTLLALSPPAFRGISFLQWAQLTRCVASLHRLESLQSVMDFRALLDGVAEKLDVAARDAMEEGPEDVFMRLASGVRTFRDGVAHGPGAVWGPGPDEESGFQDTADGLGMVVAPQKGHFRNEPGRFWLNQFPAG